MRDTHLLSQYGAKALDRVLSTILNHTENRVPVPKSYDRGEAAFFHGKNFTSSGAPAASCWPGWCRVGGARRAEQKVRGREQHPWLHSSLGSGSLATRIVSPWRHEGKRVWERLGCEVTGPASGEVAPQER